ncbi:hypothetical protein E8E13_007367 [Curvularia kusanoi]|uniref:Uncharacterized protein n=1 Tax=Curvularia kusanoi TaxID=90978 RepID=A0A9P4T8Z6_CURKU|nr:hypothetical protein E8E13_007367 [Curvularia kusanoi]
MNKTFLRYNKSIAQTGVLQVNPDLALEIKKMNENFANCVKTANDRTQDSDDEEVAAAGPVQEAQSESGPVVATEASPQRNTASVEDATPWKDTTSQPGNYLSHISSSPYDYPQSGHSTLSQVTLPFGLVDIPSREQSPYAPPFVFPVEVPAMGAEPPSPKSHQFHPTSLLDATLTPANSYSYQEVNFARRLMRGTFELAVLMLSSPHIHPAILQHIFKLSLPYLTLDDIRNRFKLILSRGVTEDLDWYATPFLHLGGAGTHYARRDPNGKPVPMKNSWTVRQIGPLDRRMIRMESVTDGQIHDLQGIDLTGFEGEFFDAYDIQGYLEDRWHCRIDARSSFAECLIDGDNGPLAGKEGRTPSLSRGSTTSNSDASTPPAPPTFIPLPPSYGLPVSLDSVPVPNPLSAPTKQNIPEISFDQTLGLDLAPSFDTGFGGHNTYSSFGFGMIGESGQLPTVRHQAKRAAWVDVQKFMDSVMRGAVCLGRGPGYRRKDVDAAFQEALILV